VSFYVAIGDVKNRNDKVEKNQSQASVLWRINTKWEHGGIKEKLLFQEVSLREEGVKGLIIKSDKSESTQGRGEDR
jgi:hypothetical protein